MFGYGNTSKAPKAFVRVRNPSFPRTPNGYPSRVPPQASRALTNPTAGTFTRGRRSARCRLSLSAIPTFAAIS
jgi:hypothetical protein